MFTCLFMLLIKIQHGQLGLRVKLSNLLQIQQIILLQIHLINIRF